MHAISDNVAFQQGSAAPSIETYRAGETVLSAASNTRQLLILKGGAVSTAAPLMRDRAQVELKRQVQDGQLSSITRKTIDKIEQSLGASGGNLAYAGYPYDPFVLDQ